MKKMTCQFSSLLPSLPTLLFFEIIPPGCCRRSFQEPDQGQSLDFTDPCQITGLLCMNAPLSNEQFQL